MSLLAFDVLRAWGSAPRRRRRLRTRTAEIVEVLEVRVVLNGTVIDVPVAESDIQERIVTVEDPSNYVVPSGQFDGVVQLIIETNQGTFLCSGSLLTSGEHILTAAHCLTDGNGTLIATSVTALFPLADGTQAVTSTTFFVHASYNGNIANGNDIAIIQLDAMAPAEADRYDIYRGTDEFDKTATKVGYGQSGTGDTGATLPAGTMRVGQNEYEAYASIFGFSAGTTQLIYDFDSGTSANDALGYWVGINDTGLGINEVNSAPGDSGGPTFIDGLIAGVTSYGLSVGDPTDVLPGVNSSYGEFSGDTRVSSYSAWIDSIVGTPPGGGGDTGGGDGSGGSDPGDGGSGGGDGDPGDGDPGDGGDGGDGGGVTDTTTYYFSTTVGGTILFADGSTLAFDDSDVLSLVVDDNGNPLSLEMVFDGSDVGLTRGGEDVDALSFLDDGSLLISTTGNASVPGIGGTRSDVFLFSPTSLGTTTAGSWSVYLDGSDVGLTTRGENVDAIAAVDGGLVLSTSGTSRVPGGTFRDEDLALLDLASTGTSSSGSWSMLLDGSDIGLSSGGEDVDGVAFDTDGNIAFTTRGNLNAGGITGADEDVFAFAATRLGSSTAGSLSKTLDLSLFGLGALDIDALHVGEVSGLPTSRSVALNGNGPGIAGVIIEDEGGSATASAGLRQSANVSGEVLASTENVPTNRDGFRLDTEVVIRRDAVDPSSFVESPGESDATADASLEYAETGHEITLDEFFAAHADNAFGDWVNTL